MYLTHVEHIYVKHVLSSFPAPYS